uniref:hypothetical protein n=1 Tax=Acinetobacter venetianus TaxID=52133 RepID=UPI0035BE3430
YPPEPADWLTVSDLLSKYDNTVAINIAYILGNGPIRIWGVGWNDRPATKDELNNMKSVVEEIQKSDSRFRLIMADSDGLCSKSI